MPKIAVILADGFEEGEALLTVDILRRADLETHTVGLTGTTVTGAHDIIVQADEAFSGSLDGFDLVVLPGGYGGAAAMRDDARLTGEIAKMNADGRKIAAICAAPIAFEAADVLEGRTFTCYPTTAAEIAHGTRIDEVVVVDGNMLTSQGPGTTFPFAYALCEFMGADPEPLKEAMRYNRALQG